MIAMTIFIALSPCRLAAAYRGAGHCPAGCAAAATVL
jgi:hypothetical protein